MCTRCHWRHIVLWSRRRNWIVNNTYNCNYYDCVEVLYGLLVLEESFRLTVKCEATTNHVLMMSCNPSLKPHSHAFQMTNWQIPSMVVCDWNADALNSVANSYQRWQKAVWQPADRLQQWECVQACRLARLLQQASGFIMHRRSCSLWVCVWVCVLACTRLCAHPCCSTLNLVRCFCFVPLQKRNNPQSDNSFMSFWFCYHSSMILLSLHCDCVSKELWF